MKKHLFLVLAWGLLLCGGDNSVTVIGIGKLGLCTALVLEEAGYDVLGVDISQTYVDALNKKTFISQEPGVNEALAKSTRFRATTAFDEGIAFSDLIMIIVATPSTPREEAYDHSALSNILMKINDCKVRDKHIVICCTIFPGYIDTIGRALLHECHNTTLSYNPEFIAQGSIMHDFRYPDAILIGEGSREAGERLEVIYRRTCRNNPSVHRMSPASAEIAKLAVNCFVTTKVAYANMIGDIADRTKNADKFEILNFVGSDSRIGKKYLKPGYGYGGPCFPRDNRALGSYARRMGITPLIPIATDTSNKDHAMIMADALKAEKRDKYIFDAVCFKENCPLPIIEESQKLVVAERLARSGCRVLIRDRERVLRVVRAEYGTLFEYESIDNLQ